MSFMDHIRACNAHDPAAFRPFEVEDTVVGHVLTAFMGRLAAFPDVFQVEDDRVILRPVFRTPEERTKAMRRATLALQKAGVLPPDHGEDYAIVEAWGRPTIFLLDRAHVSAFGLKAFGLHVNGFVRMRRMASSYGSAPDPWTRRWLPASWTIWSLEASPPA